MCSTYKCTSIRPDAIDNIFISNLCTHNIHLLYYYLIESRPSCDTELTLTFVLFVFSINRLPPPFNCSTSSSSVLIFHHDHCVPNRNIALNWSFISTIIIYSGNILKIVVASLVLYILILSLVFAK